MRRWWWWWWKGRGHGLFPQGMLTHSPTFLPACVIWREEKRGGRQGRTKCGMLLLHLNVCQRNPSSVSFTASFHFVQNTLSPSLSLPLSSSEWHLIRLMWASVHLTSSPVWGRFFLSVRVHALAGLRVCSKYCRFIPFVHPSDLNSFFGVCVCLCACLPALCRLCLLTICDILDALKKGVGGMKKRYTSWDEFRGSAVRSITAVKSCTLSMFSQGMKTDLFVKTSEDGERARKCSPAGERAAMWRRQWITHWSHTLLLFKYGF